jgi:hypothetical protein
MKNLIIELQSLGIEVPKDIEHLLFLHSLLQEALFQRCWLLDTGEDSSLHDLVIAKIRQLIKQLSAQLGKRHGMIEFKEQQQ